MAKRIPIATLHWYAARLLFIPQILRNDHGSKRCEAIGEEINRELGFEGMVAVCEFVRDQFDRTTGSWIEAAWDGIGEWRG